MVRVSQNQLSWSSLFHLGILGFLLSPFLILLFHFPELHTPDWSEFYWAFKNTFKQALGSAIVSLIFGFLAALGLMRLSFRSPWRRLLEFVGLAFNFLPPLFVIVFALGIVDFFPIGTMGIVIVHSFINAGLVAVVLARTIESQFGSMTSLAYLEGASRQQVLRALWTPIAMVSLRLGFFVFVICVSSFTVPLLVGGGMGTTLEVLIYEKIRIAGDFAGALTLALIQGGIVFGLTFLIPPLSFVQQKKSQPVQLLSSSICLGMISLYAAASVGYFFYEIFQGWSRLETIPGLTDVIREFIPFTFLIGTGVGLLTIALFFYQASVFAIHGLHRWVAGIISLSPALAAFSYLLLFGEGNSLALLLCLTCLFYPALFRLVGDSGVQPLRKQQEVAYLLGASRWKILTSVTAPQIFDKAALMAGIASVWTMGDFAISKVLMAKEISLGMLASSLTETYRIHASFAICGLILILGLFSMLTFRGMAYVYRQTSR